MDLTNLRDSLDVSSRERHPASTSAKKSELRLTRDFKSAAMQLTTLYRTSLSSAKRSYASGYTQSLQDILDVVLLRLQQSPSSAPGYSSHIHHHSHHSSDSNREELLWLVRYLRARIEAIKAESEDEEDHESEEEVEEVQNIQSSKAVRGHSAPAPVNIASSAPLERVRSADEPAITKADDIIDEQKLSKQEGIALNEEASASNATPIVPSIVTPPSTFFSFTAPSQSVQSKSIAPINTRNSPQGAVRRKVKGGASLHGSMNMTTTIVPPHSTSSVSSEEETTIVHTPSKRLSGRLGKRTQGREKASAAVNAKRRRGMGDRRDDDRRDGGLH